MAKEKDWSSTSHISGLLRPLGYKRYTEYLASDHWKQVKREYSESDLPQDCACGAKRHSLHHVTYERLGAELLTDLEPLCTPCHRKAHGRKPKTNYKRKKRKAKREKVPYVPRWER